jgi:hypothetical protein
MQNFGRGMWRRVGDYERLQIPRNVRLQNYLAFIEKQKIKHRQNMRQTNSGQNYVKHILHNSGQTKDLVEPQEIVVEPEEVVVEPEEVVVEPEEVVVEPEKEKDNNINQSCITQEELLVSEKLPIIIPKKSRKKHKNKL